MKRGLWFWLAMTVLAGALSAKPLWADTSPGATESFVAANQAFDKGDYESAIRDYQALLQQGYDSADIHFNLANSYFKAGKLGEAIFHYRKALALSPRDPDVKFNLAYAREKVADQVESHESFWSRLGDTSGTLSEKETYYLLVALAIAFAIVGVASFYRPNEWLKLARNGLLVGALVCGALLFYRSLRQEAFGVVTAPEAKVYSGVGKDNVELFALHQGVEVTVADTLGDEWVRVRLADGKQGWARSEGFVVEK